jgi:multidrug efflux system membrane fusion protein
MHSDSVFSFFRKSDSKKRLFLSIAKWCLAFSAGLCSCSSPPPAKHDKKFPVAITEVTAQDVVIFIEAIGNVYSPQTVQVRPQVGGIIKEAYVKQGQYVKKGDPLYLIDPRPYQANLDLALAALKKDQAQLKFDVTRVNRYTELVKKDFFAKINFEQFLANVEIDEALIKGDKANIALAELNLEWCKPTSPIDGKLSQYLIYPGNLVIVDDPNALTDIRVISPIDIQFTINQNDFVTVQQSMRKGDLRFTASLPQDPKNPREGIVYFVDNHIDLSTGTILLKGSIDNEDEFFWPGEFARVRLETSVRPNAIVVAEEAIAAGQTGPYVYVYHSETSSVEYRPVVTGERIGKLVLIEEGLTAGEKVIAKGQLNLRPGSKVFIPNEQSSPEPQKK